jgi:formyl-CoA transferase
MAALIARSRTGRGQRVETSLFEAALALSVWESTEYFATAVPPGPLGSAHRLNAPYQAFRTRDGHINIAALTDGQWTRLCAVLGCSELVDDGRFADNAARMANRAALVTEMERALATDTTAHWVERLLDAGVPAGPILDYRQVFDDPHTRARGMIEEIEHPIEGRIRTLGFPIVMSATPAAVRRPPPRLGEHTRELLHELGFEGDAP